MFTKIEVLDLLGHGETIANVASMFNVNESTIRSIKKSEDKIRSSVKSSISSEFTHIKNFRSEAILKTERALIIWIEEMSVKGIPLTGDTIRDKAKLLYEFYTNEQQTADSSAAATPTKSFVASKGWLHKFLKRSGFHNVEFKGRSAPIDRSASEKFQEVLTEFINEGGHLPDHILNTDPGPKWRKISRRTYRRCSNNDDLN